MAHISRPPQTDGKHEYQDPEPTAVRSPCPFLNTMANHGYIRRDGRYLTFWAATRGMIECYNFSLGLALFVAAAAIWTSLFTNGNPFWFDLSELQVHNNISVEHDASLTRQDVSTGDNWHPDPKLISEMLSTSSSPDGSLSVHDYAQFRVLREKTLPRPFAAYSAPRDFLATGEVGLIIPAIGRGADDPLQRKINAEWAKSFFGQARLPPGWTPAEQPVTLGQVNTIRKKMQEFMKAIREGNKSV